MCVCVSVSRSESLHYDRIQQGHVLGSSDWQLVCSVVVDDLRDGGEGRAVLSEHVTSVCRLSELHVHEALTTPDRERSKREKIHFCLSDSIQRLLRHLHKTDSASLLFQNSLKLRSSH